MATGTRAVVVGSIVVAACAPHFDRHAHSGRDDDAGGARLIQLDHGVAFVSGIVTARGGDADDWFAFAVPRGSCPRGGEVVLSPRWKTARPGLRLKLDVFDGRRRPLLERWMARRPRVIVPASADGRYFLRIEAPGQDDAGSYTVGIFAASEECPPPPPPRPPAPPVHLTRPSSYTAPAVPLDPGERAVAVTRIDLVGHHGTVELGVGRDDGVEPGARATLVDHLGHPFAGGGLEIRDVGATTSEAVIDLTEAVADRVDGGVPPWTAVLLAPPPPPPWPRGSVESALTSFHPRSSGDTVLELDRGRADGVEVGWRGALVHPSGVPVPGSGFVIVEVELHRAIGVASELVISNKDSLRAVIAPPGIAGY